MAVRKPSRVKRAERSVTPLRFSYFQTHGSKRGRSARRGRQLSKLKAHGCNRDSFRVLKAGGRCLNGGTPTSDHGEQGPSAAGAAEGFSQDSTSVTMPSGVSSFLLDCLDVGSPTSVEDSTLSSIEEFREADNYDEGNVVHREDGSTSAVKNSTLLDLSHAQDIGLQPRPNLSSILELSLDPVEYEEKAFSLSPNRLSPGRVSSESSASGVPSGVLRSVEERTPANTRPVALSPVLKKCFAETRKLIKCRKVTFSDILSVRNVSSHKRDPPDGSAPEESSDVPSRPVRFFDFADESEREAFFHRLKQRRSFTFPAKPILSTV